MKNNDFSSGYKRPSFAFSAHLNALASRLDRKLPGIRTFELVSCGRQSVCSFSVRCVVCGLWVVRYGVSTVCQVSAVDTVKMFISQCTFMIRCTDYY
jgi:hypothetical protein